MPNKKSPAPAKQGQDQVLAEISETLKKLLKVQVARCEFETGTNPLKEE